MGLQGSPITWVSTHRYHHQFVDSERDPHSPTAGFWFSHISWLFDTTSINERVWFFFFFFFLSKETVWISTIFLTTPHKQGLMIVYLGVVDYYCFWYVLQCGGPNNVGDLRKQPFYRFLEKTYVIHPIALGALLNGLGGFPFLVWGMVSKIVCLFILIKLYSTEFLGTRWMLKISTHTHTHKSNTKILQFYHKFNVINRGKNNEFM